MRACKPDPWEGARVKERPDCRRPAHPSPGGRDIVLLAFTQARRDSALVPSPYRFPAQIRTPQAAQSSPQQQIN